ncbi:hypothetical protein V5T82_16345 [Magnetovibrio sp. PR-2]|uniref:hypothetical protein n=1 Tax=Magnetovibrio sp. PR-2 TaxID=3120356 RepID=UPI002FCE46A9
MNETDKIAQRVQAARGSLSRVDADYERSVARAKRELNELRDTIAKQNAALDKNQKDFARLEQDLRDANTERKRYKELLVSLLNAIEEREDVHNVQSSSQIRDVEEGEKGAIKAQNAHESKTGSARRITEISPNTEQGKDVAGDAVLHTLERDSSTTPHIDRWLERKETARSGE